MRMIGLDIPRWLVWGVFATVIIAAAGWAFLAGYRLAQTELLGG